MSTHARQPLSNAGRTTPETTDSELELDEILHLISNKRRRYTIEHIHHNGSLNFGALVDAVAAREYGPGPDPAERKRVYSSLRQSHLGQLRDAGIIEYTDLDSEIQRGGEMSVAVEYLSRLEREPGLMGQVSTTVSGLLSFG